MIVLVGVTSLILETANESSSRNFAIQAEALLDLNQSHYQQGIEHSAQILELVTELPQTKALWSQPDPQQQTLLGDYLHLLAQSHIDILQLRILDTGGQERVRINHEGDRYYKVADADLQNKAGRYYHQASMALGPNELYLSEIDLNIEHGKVVRPFEPTLRISRQIIIDHETKGYAIVNLNLRSFVDQLNLNQAIQVYLVNAQGEIIVGPDKQWNWAKDLGKPPLKIAQVVGAPLHLEAYEAQQLPDNTFIRSLQQTPEQSYFLVARPSTAFWLQADNPFLLRKIAETLLLLLLVTLIAWYIGRFLSHALTDLEMRSNVLNAIDDSVFVHEPEGKILYVNRSAQEKLGYSEDELLSLRIPDIDAPENQNNLATLNPDLLKRGSLTFRISHRHQKGYLIPQEIKAVLVNLDETPLVVSVARDISSILNYETKLKHFEAYYRNLMENSPVGIAEFSANGRLDFMNHTLLSYLDLKRYQDFYTEYWPQNKKQIVKFLMKVRAEQKLNHEILELHNTKLGKSLILEVNASLTEDKLIASVMDLSAHYEQMKLNAMLSEAMAQIDDLVMISNTDGIILYVNDAFTKHTGYTREEAVGRKTSLLNSSAHPDSFYDELWHTIERGLRFKGTFTNRKKNGDVFFEEKTISPIKDAKGNVERYVATGKDISERVALEQRLQKMAEIDYLTQIYNRNRFESALKESLSLYRRHGGVFSIIMLDVDHFKHINDNFGHDVGDQVLIHLVEVVHSRLRDSDIFARWGGEEFMIYLPLTPIDDAVLVAESIRQKVAACDFSPVPRVTISLGLAEVTADDTIETLTKRADDALYKAKEGGRNQYRIHT
ncbi:GGDEF domain-containing protein [Thiomicrorhabdus cannonii]|uniref:GGDEF domain-containing protein n=1 Tax=Thiomicrorhabdus cannonii TaxID=2748011 RepID=UPI0015BFAE06|nr:diguanylate cyclase [Thiomicrorhabdus cannonii]